MIIDYSAKMFVTYSGQYTSEQKYGVQLSRYFRGAIP